MMTDTPPTNPDAQQADEAELSIQEQLDHLLGQIETEEPGTIEPTALPAGFESKAAKPEQAEDTVAQAMASFEQALEPEAEAQPAATPAADAQASIESAEQPEAPQAAAPTAAADAATPADQAEADMLASLNAALQDLGSPADPTPAAPADVPAQTSTPAPEGASQTPPAESDSEALLQNQISDLLNAASESPETPAPAPAPTPTPAPADEQSTSVQDQIADEIKGLLDAEPEPQQGDPEPSMDQLDQMLAEEIDEDDELAGDFQSVQDITAGIETPDANEKLQVDEHAATASDVAAELDSQPEDLATAGATEGEDPLAALDEFAATAKPNTRSHERQGNPQPTHWRDKVANSQTRLLQTCFAINWPARRFLSYEWRETLGYISMTVAVSAVAVWLYLILM